MVKKRHSENEPRRTPNGNLMGCTEGSNDAPTIEKLIMARQKTGMKKLNINDIIKVKLTDLGKDIFYHQYDELNKRYGREVIKPRFPGVDEDGFTKIQLWHFMNIYGPHIWNGCKPFIENNAIYICEEDLEDYNESIK